jgi:predicted TPR repeat methyltransferase
MLSAPLRASSGDLIADRRYAIARELAARGELAGAADVLVQALDRAPDFAAAWFALGEVRERRGDARGAVEAFRRALAIDPADSQGAGLRAARLEGGAASMPPAYVRTLFDQYAPHYDRALVEDLAYRAPRLLREAVERVQAARGLPPKFRRMLDLGCGTGLAAEAFADCCEAMFGIDISPGMIEQARRKNLYAGLAVADLVEALAFLPLPEGERACPGLDPGSILAEGEDRVRGSRSGIPARSPSPHPSPLRGEGVECGSPQQARADLIVAADVFAYLGDLEPVCRAAAAVLEPDGLFAFTAETQAGEGVVLGEKLRYAHSGAHVRTALEAAGLSVLTLAEASLRTEAGVPVPGLVAVAGPGEKQ